MSPHLYTLLTGVHGLCATLALALLAHPTFRALRRPLRPAEGRLVRWGSLLLTLPILLGWWLYPSWRVAIKPTFWQDARPWVLAFEVKEHLGAFAVMLSLAAAALTRAPLEREAGRAPLLALLVPGWCFGVVAAVLGLVIGGRVHPGWTP